MFLLCCGSHVDVTFKDVFGQLNTHLLALFTSKLVPNMIFSKARNESIHKSNDNDSEKKLKTDI